MSALTSEAKRAAMKTMEVETAHSARTRAYGSCSRRWSTMASLTWSQSLSGWPSVTDSEMKMKSFFIKRLSSLPPGEDSRSRPERHGQGDFRHPDENQEHPGGGDGPAAKSAPCPAGAHRPTHPESEDAQQAHHQGGQNERQAQHAGADPVGDVVQHQGQAQEQAFLQVDLPRGIPVGQKRLFQDEEQP